VLTPNGADDYVLRVSLDHLGAGVFVHLNSHGRRQRGSSGSGSVIDPSRNTRGAIHHTVLGVQIGRQHGGCVQRYMHCFADTVEVLARHALGRQGLLRLDAMNRGPLRFGGCQHCHVASISLSALRIGSRQRHASYNLTIAVHSEALLKLFSFCRGPIPLFQVVRFEGVPILTRKSSVAHPQACGRVLQGARLPVGSPQPKNIPFALP